MKRWENSTIKGLEVGASTTSSSDSNLLKTGCSAFLTPSTFFFQEREKCYNEKYKHNSRYYPNSTSFATELSVDVATVMILAESFEFLDRLNGRGLLKFYMYYPYPDVYWVAAVKPFCYTTYVYKDKVRSHMLAKAKINSALKELRKFPSQLGCSENTTFMRRHMCFIWTA